MFLYSHTDSDFVCTFVKKKLFNKRNLQANFTLKKIQILPLLYTGNIYLYKNALENTFKGYLFL